MQIVDRSNTVGVVLIGRNEGDRLVRSLESLKGRTKWVVYVDSGSTDCSIEEASNRGAIVVRLCSEQPFTAARARNAGFAALLNANSALEYVQFIDGDCVMDPGWLGAAWEFLDLHPEHAIVCGNRKELYPDRTLYNLLCDLEWYGPEGDVEACGGDFMVRVAAFQEVGGFNPALIAGEEPEMCHRMQANSYRVYRLDRAMTHHDVAMTQLRQWARRSSRSGYAYAARAALHWRDGTRYCWRENARIVAWALLLPAGSIALSIAVSPWCLLLLLLYPLQFSRIWYRLRKEHPTRPVFSAAGFTVLGKWPEFHGQCLYLVRSLARREQRLIEYK